MLSLLLCMEVQSLNAFHITPSTILFDFINLSLKRIYFLVEIILCKRFTLSPFDNLG